MEQCLSTCSYNNGNSAKGENRFFPFRCIQLNDFVISIQSMPGADVQETW